MYNLTVILWLFLILFFFLVTIQSKIFQSYSEDEELSKIQEYLKQLHEQLDNADEVDRQIEVKISILYYQLGSRIQELWLSKQLPGNIISEALQSYDLSLTYAHNVPDISVVVLLSKGVLLKMMGKGEDTLKAYDTAQTYVKSNADIATLEYNRGDALLMMGRLNSSIVHFTKSINLVPCKTERYYGYIQTLKELNQLKKNRWEEKLQLLQKIEKKCIDNGISSTQIEALRQQEAIDKKLSEAPKSFIYKDIIQGYQSTKHSDFYNALFIVFEKLQDYDRAWEVLEKAKMIEKAHRHLQFDRSTHIVAKNNTINIFNPQLLATFPDIEDEASMVPIFVVGMMRSGSTLIETMLDTHPNIWGMGEDSLFNANLTYLRDTMVSITSSTKLSSFQMQYQLKNLLLDFGDETVRKMKESVTRISSGEKINPKELKFVVDKMLFNYKNIGFINAVYPNALIIHMIRDPLDTLLSCYRNKFDDNGLEWTLNSSDLVLQYTLYLEYMRHFHKLLPGRIIDVRYEELVHNPEHILRKIMTDLDLEYSPSLLEFHEKVRRVQTNSQSQIRQQLYSHSIGQWRKYANHLTPIINEFQKFVPYLKSRGALPYEDLINWEMNTYFPYETIYLANRAKSEPADNSKQETKADSKPKAPKASKTSTSKSVEKTKKASSSRSDGKPEGSTRKEKNISQSTTKIPQKPQTKSSVTNNQNRATRDIEAETFDYISYLDDTVYLDDEEL